MKSNLKGLAVVVSLLVLLFSSGCAGKRAQGGAGICAATGAVIGQAVGRSTEATLIGLAAGALLGYIIGNEMDKYDRQQIAATFEKTPSNQCSSWVNPDSGAEYTVVPRSAYRDRMTRRICHKAKILTVIDGKAERIETTACRCPATGRWELQ